MTEEGQKAWQAWIDGCQIYPRTPFKDIDGELKIAWQFVERTITNEALRRAAEVADGYHKRALEWAKKVRGLEQHVGETDSSRIAAGIRALIKEPGHE